MSSPGASLTTLPCVPGTGDGRSKRDKVRFHVSHLHRNRHVQIQLNGGWVVTPIPRRAQGAPRRSVARRGVLAARSPDRDRARHSLHACAPRRRTGLLHLRRAQNLPSRGDFLVSKRSPQRAVALFFVGTRGVLRSCVQRGHFGFLEVKEISSVSAPMEALRRGALE